MTKWQRTVTTANGDGNGSNNDKVNGNINNCKKRNGKNGNGPSSSVQMPTKAVLITNWINRRSELLAKCRHEKKDFTVNFSRFKNN